jgi:hypothetical protein
MKNLELVFDNGGSLTIQRDDYVHSYDGGDYFVQAAEDYKLLLVTDDVSDWDGNNPDDRVEPTDDQLHNGGYIVIDNPVNLDCETKSGWRNLDDFQRAYFGAAYSAED